MCIKDGLSKLKDRPEVKEGEIYHVIDEIPHTQLNQDEVRVTNAAEGTWYYLAEIPFYHWSGLFEELQYEETLE